MAPVKLQSGEANRQPHHEGRPENKQLRPHDSGSDHKPEEEVKPTGYQVHEKSAPVGWDQGEDNEKKAPGLLSF